MGIYVDYTLVAECEDEELQARLERVRQRCMDLPLRSVGEVRRVAPVYDPTVFMILEDEGHALPEAIAERLRAAEDDHAHGDRCISFAPMFLPKLPRHMIKRYLRPALRFMETTDLWNKEKLPDEVAQTTPWGWSPITFNRGWIELMFASLVLRYGYLLYLDPGEGSETVNLALSTFDRSRCRRSPKPPLWYGQGFTKTQYARKFVQVHETVCRVMDIVGEEGLLLEASDTCGYYAGRSWEAASENVNKEMAFAQLVSGLFGAAVGGLREAGAEIEIVEDNASKARPVDFTAALERERAARSRRAAEAAAKGQGTQAPGDEAERMGQQPDDEAERTGERPAGPGIGDSSSGG